MDGDDADQLIIQRVLAGHRDAFRVLISRYSDPLYRHALCMTGSPDVAEDILQVSFIKAYQHLAEVRGRFDAWVFRIVANGCKDWLKNIRRSHLSYEEDDQPSSYATPDEDLDRTELRTDLDRALAVLPASLPEASVRRGETAHDVEFWKQLGEESERRRHMRMPLELESRIMEALPYSVPALITPWYRREFVVTPGAAVTIGATLVTMTAAVT